jgi:hypothetical protein
MIDLRAAMGRARRVCLASPTGSGKTIMFCWLARAVAEHRARILISRTVKRSSTKSPRHCAHSASSTASLQPAIPPITRRSRSPVS